MLELINQHVAKIVLATEEGDSVSRISRKIGASYGWTHRWVERLEEIEVIERENGIRIVDEEFVEKFEVLTETVLKKKMDLKDAYILPNLAKMPYAYTKSDAVFVWTKGGYRIGRSRDNYPIFINVREEDVERWQQFFDDFDMEAFVEERQGEGIYYVMFPQPEIEAEWVEDARVIPRQETVEWAQRYEVNFQPALEMLSEMYDLELGVSYRESNVL